MEHELKPPGLVQVALGRKRQPQEEAAHVWWWLQMPNEATHVQTSGLPPTPAKAFLLEKREQLLLHFG